MKLLQLTDDEAREILYRAINHGHWIDWDGMAGAPRLHFGEYVSLDGDFTVKELEAIIHFIHRD